MKINEYDRIQAIIRCPQYEKDYKNIYKLIKTNPSYSLDPKYIEFKNRWKILVPLDPQEIKQQSEKDILWLYRMSPVLVMGKWFWDFKGVGFAGGGFLSRAESPPKRRIPKKINLSSLLNKIDFSENLEAGRYLILRIDLWAKRKEILKGVRQKFTSYRKYVKLPEGRERNPEFDPWKVWDMYKEGKTYKEIVMEIHPTQDKALLLARTDAVRKTYQKACKMIQAVTPIGF